MDEGSDPGYTVVPARGPLGEEYDNLVWRALGWVLAARSRPGELEELVREDGLQLVVGNPDGLGRLGGSGVGFDDRDGLEAGLGGVEGVVLEQRDEEVEVLLHVVLDQERLGVRYTVLPELHDVVLALLVGADLEVVAAHLRLDLYKFCISI